MLPYMTIHIRLGCIIFAGLCMLVDITQFFKLFMGWKRDHNSSLFWNEFGNGALSTIFCIHTLERSQDLRFAFASGADDEQGVAYIKVLVELEYYLLNQKMINLMLSRNHWNHPSQHSLSVIVSNTRSSMHRVLKRTSQQSLPGNDPGDARAPPEVSRK